MCVWGGGGCKQGDTRESKAKGAPSSSHDHEHQLHEQIGMEMYPAGTKGRSGRGKVHPMEGGAVAKAGNAYQHKRLCVVLGDALHQRQMGITVLLTPKHKHRR